MIGSIPMQVEESFPATFTQGVGEVTVVSRKTGKIVTLEIPAGSTADGGDSSIAAPAGTVPPHLRPAADISFPAVVTSNAAKVVGKLVVDSDGSLVFQASAADGKFTDDAAAGFDRIAVTYTLA